MDSSLSTSDQIEAELCRGLAQLRLSRNITQKQLARDAGVSWRTIQRMEAGQGVALDTFVRVLMALGLQHNLALLIPDSSIRPVERVQRKGHQRQRARQKTNRDPAPTWTWADQDADD